MSNMLHKRKCSSWIMVSQNGKRFQNRLKHYREIATQTWPKMNTVMRLLPTGSSWWSRQRHLFTCYHICFLKAGRQAPAFIDSERCGLVTRGRLCNFYTRNVIPWATLSVVFVTVRSQPSSTNVFPCVYIVVLHVGLLPRRLGVIEMLWHEVRDVSGSRKTDNGEKVNQDRF